jgi:hypothetical protein
MGLMIEELQIGYDRNASPAVSACDVWPYDGQCAFAENSAEVQAPGSAQPSSSSIDPQIVDRFITHQRQMLAKMRSLEDRDPAGIIITSPFASVMVYNLLDAFRFIVAHERRHFAQAQRVMEADGFPR